jgi:hypothetical protein
MKAAVLVVGLLALPLVARAAEIDPAVVQLWDVVYTSDGSVLKGVIVEEIPGTSLRVVLVGGSSLVVPIANVVRLTKELNPAFQPGGPAARGPAAPMGPAVTAASGLRIGVLPGVAVHSELDESTFLLTGRLGWEVGLDRWGLTPGVSLLYAADTGNYGNDSLGGAATVRAAYRGSTISPVVGFGIGVDFVSGDPSLATFMTAGIDLLVHRRIALTAEGRLHRGFGGTYTDTHQFAAIGMGVEIRL